MKQDIQENIKKGISFFDCNKSKPDVKTLLNSL